MTGYVYYNEKDRQKAAWLRELISRNLIAPGEVDERSIEEVRPSDVAGYSQCHFFAGIGVWSYALRQAGWPDSREVWTGSCPCQSFSIAGKHKGFADDRHLWPYWFRLIATRKPSVVFGEQSSSKDALAWLDLVCDDLEGANYSCRALDLCAASVGAPHIRQRLYFVAESESERFSTTFAGMYGNSRETESSSCDTDKLADANKTGPQGRSERRDGSSKWIVGQDGLVDELADSASIGQQWGRPSETLPYAGTVEEPERLCDAGGLGHANCSGCKAWKSERIQGYSWIGGIERSSVSNVMADSNGRIAGNGDVQRSGEYGLLSQDSGIGDGDYQPGPTNGFWRDADWLLCRDDKWRPVESSTFPLAHGSACRVGRLRGYGDAIVAQVAQAFIEAYLEGL